MEVGCKITPFAHEQLGAFVLLQDDCLDFTVWCPCSFGMGNRSIYSVNEVFQLFYWCAFQPLRPWGLLLECLKHNRWSVTLRVVHMSMSWRQELAWHLGSYLALLQCCHDWPLILLIFEKKYLATSLFLFWTSFIYFSHSMQSRYNIYHLLCLTSLNIFSLLLG